MACVTMAASWLHPTADLGADRVRAGPGPGRAGTRRRDRRGRARGLRRAAGRRRGGARPAHSVPPGRAGRLQGPDRRRPRGRLPARSLEAALAWHVVVIPPARHRPAGPARVQRGRDAAGAGRAGLPARLRAHRRLRGPRPGRPGLAMWKGDEVAACVAAASIVAKVTRDRIMTELHLQYPQYGFARHKGYSTRATCALGDARAVPGAPDVVRQRGARRPGAAGRGLRRAACAGPGRPGAAGRGPEQAGTANCG